MEYWELRDLLRISLALYDAIVSVDRHHCGEVEAGRGSFSRERALEIQRLYADWDQPTDAILQRIEAVEKAGFVVEEAERFRGACLDARFAVNTDIDEMLEGIKELEEGRGVPLEVARDELRRRRGNAGEARPSGPSV
jgi:hypothetical protein